MTVYIGNTVRDMRKKSGLSQTELAQNVGCSLRSISAIERNESQPTATQLKELSGFFNVSVDYLIFGSDVGVSPVEREILKLVRDDSGLFKSLIDMLNSKKSLMNRLAA